MCAAAAGAAATSAAAGGDGGGGGTAADVAVVGAFQSVADLEAISSVVFRKDE